MPTNRTPNYGLCQWEATDKVLHDDFNEDNQKIDAALGSLAARTGLVLLDEITVAKDSGLILVPLELDWNEWKIIHIDLFPAEGSSSSMYICGSASYADSLAPIPAARCHIMFLPMGRPDTLVNALVLGPTLAYGQRNFSFRIFNDFSFQGKSAEYQMKAGSKIIIRGERV